ncbi:peptidase M23 [Colwellia sp. 39_35_sub15_T18]|nr:peptidase M23 [Colwellia sp. 39_35_sub15_T18]
MSVNNTATITLAQVTQDVSYLASDTLNGRGNFSTDIHQAADYIAKRFKEAGLSPVAGNDGFYQEYAVQQIHPKTLELHINGQSIATEKLAFASTVENFTWTMPDTKKQPSSVKVHSIGKKDDMRAALSELNNQGGQHLVLLHSAHKDIFQRYQHYFAQGLTKLASSETNSQQGGTIVIALTDTSTEQLNSFSVIATSTISISKLTNVVAMLPGTTKADEIVLYSAHYDHLGSTENTGATDTIFNGADDDASGTAAVINLAQHFAQQGNNKRSLLFAAFSAEEIGGFGSRYFSKQLDARTITAMINIEMIGKPSKFGAGTVWMTGMERSDLGEQLNAALIGTGMKIHQDPYPEQGLFYRSDNATLARLGVPAHSFSSTQLDKDQHYHQVSDDLASLNLPSLHKVIKALAIATQPLVDGKITPSRIDTNLVKKKGLIY